MIVLSLHYRFGPVSARDIADTEAMPLNYLEQILSRLKQAGLVKTVRGPRGGYALSRMPSSIKVKDIMDALQRSPYLIDCLNAKAKYACPKKNSCPALLFWQQLNKSIQATASSTSLEDLSVKIPKHAGVKHNYAFQI
jgi:Rrf2 family transcriptional regulator, cysteine metabolism repressor